MKELLFDHLVHYSEAPERVQNEFQSLGFQTVLGGQHPNWGTHNSLCFFQGIRYIEWIGLTDVQLAKRSENVLIQQIVEDLPSGEGFVQFAFRTYNIKKLAETFKGKGLRTIGPFEGNRKRQDGSTLGWSMLFVEDLIEDEGIRYPFFIQWDEKEEVRNQQFLSMMEHDNHANTIDVIGIAVSNIDRAVKSYRQLFDLEEKDLELLNDSFGSYKELNGVGGITLRFYQPTQLELKCGKPFLCGISGTKLNSVGKYNHSFYVFSE